MKRKKELNYNMEAQALQRELDFANATIYELREQVKKIPANFNREMNT